ncbi:MAG: hypothetical protein WCD45_10595 [Gallionella sp.]
MKKILAIALLILSSQSHAETLGRLFFTPQQREQIDVQELQNQQQHSSTLTVNGIVQKHGGARIVWLNGVAQPSVSAQENSASVTLSLPNKNHAVTIKVGERIQLAPDTK